MHCVIVGFSIAKNSADKKLFDNGNDKVVKNINPFLIESPTIFIASRSTPICNVPEMVYGNKPTDGGFLFLTSEERENILLIEPKIEKYIKQIYDATEFINNKLRYCIWLVNVSPADIRGSKFLSHRITGVKNLRLNSTKEATKHSADTPMLFQEIRQPNTTYILIPRHSSETRQYIPICLCITRNHSK